MNASTDTPATAETKPWRVAIIGAGPVGLSLALLLARRCPLLDITVWDARPWEQSVRHDPRTLALSLGSIHTLQSLGIWDICLNAQLTQAITHIHVSQVGPTRYPTTMPTQPEVHIRASDVDVPQLGAVLKYGHLLDSLQQAWAQQQAQAPERLHNYYGQAVKAIRHTLQGRVDMAVVETDQSQSIYDLAIVAEGGVFQTQINRGISTPQARTPLHHSYDQTAWVGTVTLTGMEPGLAIERFTSQGPLALLPLPPSPTLTSPSGMTRDSCQAAMVWCVNSTNDCIDTLSDAERMHAINALLPSPAGQVVAISPLKSFALGLKVEPRLVESGCIVRIGNAAQTLHPVAGQGLNLGLRDAQFLAHQLRLACQRGYSLKKTLCRFQLQREPDRWGLIAITDFLARSFTWQFQGTTLVRGLALDALERAPILKRWMAHKFMWGTR